MSDSLSSVAGPAVPTPDALSALRPLGLDTVRLLPTGLLGGWQQRNAAATLPHCVAQVARAGNLSNLRRVTGEHDGPFRGMWFADSDLYKTVEAAAWEIASRGAAEPALQEFRDGLGALLAKAQDDDGYLNSYYQVDHRDRQWRELRISHELYCAGHLIQAAVAAVHADKLTGTHNGEQLVAVARRFADLLVERYGPDGEDGVCGHPEIETALVELHRVTGHEPYLALAARFIDLRGRGLLGTDQYGAQYYQDHAGVREADEATGHVVRQLYLLAGAVDVAVERRDTELLAAAERLWESAIGTKTYLTGGQGSRHRDEAFGDAYELPPDRAYAESCAAIASFQLSWRLLLATGRARYADEMERVLYNGIAASTGADGTTFFYSNPLQLRTGHDGSGEDAPSERLSWYRCSCCPPNLARLMASLQSYVASADGEGVQVHLYGDAVIAAGGRTVEVSSEYPWDGRVAVTVRASTEGPWTLALRIPAWCTGYDLTVDGEPVLLDAEAGYLRLNRDWHEGAQVVLTLAMPVRLIAADPRVDAVRGTVALQRGPLVYCVEHGDVPLGGAVFEDVELVAGAVVHAVPGESGLIPVSLTTTGLVRAGGPGPLYRDAAAGGSEPTPVSVPLTAIPYFLWNNRGAGPMRVWLPLNRA